MKEEIKLKENIDLSKIRSPEDIKGLDNHQLEQLSKDIRTALVKEVSYTGGHLASNLGVVELTIALHNVFQTPNDKIIWDVGHQSYVHKILTGRYAGLKTIRTYKGLAGFPKTNESEHDAFNTGHSSTSISAALGMAKARDIKKQDNYVIAVIGDGAMTGGMAFEALNDAGHSNTNLIVILNDNEMSISKNVGGMSRYLSKIRTKPVYYKVKEDIEYVVDKIPAIGKQLRKLIHKMKGSLKLLLLPGIIFEELGFKYYGPIDGHNLSQMNDIFSSVKNIKGPILLHVCTEKGRGYEPAQKNPERFHSAAPFHIESGLAKHMNKVSYSKIFGDKLYELAKDKKNVVAISAAMPSGTGLDKIKENIPERFFDVGIAEQHAVTFAAGLAISGLKPVFAVYSSFLQRAYDQVLHDVCLQNLNVIFAIDRAGIVGADGETHQGVYDLSYLASMPNMTIMVPADYTDMKMMLAYLIKDHKGPAAIRYPRGAGVENIGKQVNEFIKGKGITLRSGMDITLIGIGTTVEKCFKAAELLSEKGIECDVINARYMKPLDKELILYTAGKTGYIITVEDNVTIGGFGHSVLALLNEHNVKAKVGIIGCPDSPIEHGAPDILYDLYGMTSEAIAEYVIKIKKAVN